MKFTAYESNCQQFDSKTTDSLNSHDHLMTNPLKNGECARETSIVEASASDLKPLTTLDSTKIYKHYDPSVRFLHIRKTVTGSCGFNLTRTKWDPYPWVNAVDAHTAAEMSGLKAGDCVLEVNGEDVLGLRIKDIAKLVQAKSGHVTLLLWSCGSDFKCDAESICCAPMPLTLQRLATIVQSVLSIIECPVCLDTIAPPALQCQNGHLLCLNCRIRAEKCPICRDRYTPQHALIAEQIYAAITSAYNLCSSNEDKLRQKLFGGVGDDGYVGGSVEGENDSATSGSVKSRRLRRAEAAKHTIAFEGDQELRRTAATETGKDERREKTEKRWRSQKQIKREQFQSQHVALSDSVQSGRFSFIKDADVDALEVDATVVVAGTSVTDVNAANEEKKKNRNLMKLWNGKAASMENLATTTRSGRAKIKRTITCGQQMSRGVIDMTAPSTSSSMEFFSNRSDNNQVKSEQLEQVIKNLQNHSPFSDNNSDDNSTRSRAEEATTTIKNTPMTADECQQMPTQTQMPNEVGAMEAMTIALNSASTNKAFLNGDTAAAATTTPATTTSDNIAHVNSMSKPLLLLRVLSSAAPSTNDLPPPMRSSHSDRACKNNETAETVKYI